MTRFCICATLVLILLLPSISIAVSFSGPEGIAFDSLRNRYLVMNYHSGQVIEIDSLGETSEFMSGFSTAYANWIVGDSLYMTVNQNTVLGMNLSTGDTFMQKPIAVVQHLDGITADTSGNVYALDTGGRLHRIRVSDQSAELVANQGIPIGAQDIVFDKEHNRILVCCYTATSTVLAVDLSDGSVTVLVPSGTIALDGIDRDDRGNTYVSSSGSVGHIYRFDSTFTKRDTISTDHDGPAGLCYNVRDREIAVPNFNDNTVSIIDDPYFLDDDLDGIINGTDNCPYTFNPGQEDSDDDSIGDDCDICPSVSDPDQEDSDADGAGDACDICPGFDDFADTDGDEVPDSCDNCPNRHNPDQADEDMDLIGDACDFLCGDADGSVSVDIDDVVFLITYIFASGTPPDPLGSGDADCSDAIDIDDVVYLITYIFAGGSQPCAEC